MRPSKGCSKSTVRVNFSSALPILAARRLLSGRQDITSVRVTTSIQS